MFLNLVAPPRLISISALNRFFSAGASISAKSLRYVRLSEAIQDGSSGLSGSPRCSSYRPARLQRRIAHSSS